MKLISLIVLLISLVFFYTAPNYPSRPFMGFCTIIAIFLIVLQIKGYCTDKELKKIYLRHSTIFLIFFFIVFFQRATDFSLGIIDQDSISVYDLRWAYVPSVVSKASALALLALSTFLFGYHCYSPRLLKDCIYTYKFRSKYFLVTSGFGLLFVYVALTGIGDFSKHSEDENMGFLMVAQAVLLAIVVIYSYEYKNKVNAKSIRILYFLFPLSLILFYLFVYFATGNRGGAIKVCLMLLASYVYIAKDGVNYKRIFVLFIIGAFSMTLIGIIRMQETKKLNEISSLISAKETISPLTVELSGSVNTVHLVLANVPIKQNYNWGTSFINGFSVLVPGLSRITHGVAEPSGETITKMYFGENMPDWGWGFGSSCIADVYISFGILGIIVIFFFLGRFIHYLEYGTFVADKSPYFLILSFCVFSQFHSLCRGSFSILFLSWDYAVLLVFLFVQCYKKRKIIHNT